MLREEFISSLRRRSPPIAEEQLELAGRAVLERLGEVLSRLEAEALAQELPPPFNESLRLGRHGQELEVDEFCARVALGEGARLAEALEHVSIVLGALAERVPAEVIERLRLELPKPIADYLVRPEPVTRAPAVHLHAERHTLAEGRGGSARPLSEARPDRAQSGSVAREENPHGDRKLSSSRGLTQEQEDETLAAGKPGSSRPLSGR